MTEKVAREGRVAKETPMLRLPPHSIEAEQALIGGLLLNNEAWHQIADKVAAKDFYRDDHRRIFRHLIALIDGGRAADVVTMAEAIEKANEVDQTGGIAYLGDIANNTPSAAHVAHYAAIVRENAILRKLIAASDEIGASAFNARGRSARTLLDEAESKIFEIAEEGARGPSGLTEGAEILREVVDRIQALYDRDDHDGITGTSTGFTDLDNLSSGLQAGDMIVIAGRPAMGKTAIALNIAEHIGVQLRLPVAIFSLEMSKPQVMQRMLSSVGRIDQERLKNGRLTDDDWDRMTSALHKLHDAPIEIDDAGALNPVELRARCRRFARKHKGRVGLIVIDYLQLMTSAQDAIENRATEIAEVSRSVKALAKELACPVIALSQLSRKVEERADKRPLMSDLRESGSIEQDSDIIVMMYREEYYKPDTPDKGIAEAIVVKHRNGPTGTVKLTFLGHLTKFQNWSHQVPY
jgi:replicative DNA helicase